MRVRFDRSFYIKPEDTLIPSPAGEAAAVAVIRPFGEGRWEYLCFRGRAGRPSEHHWVRSRELAEGLVSKFFESVAAGLKFMQDRKEQRKASLDAARNGFLGEVGSIFVSSWGYEQTNVDAYQVVRRVSRTRVEVVEIPVCSEGLTGNGMADNCMPVRLPQEKAETLPRITLSISSKDALRLPKSYKGVALLWDGKHSYYRSWYA